MASLIANAYQVAFTQNDKRVGQTFSAKEIRFIMGQEFPAINPASLNPSDYCGIRDAEGTVKRSASQAMQYAPLLFEKTASGLYKVLPLNEAVGKPASARSMRGATDAQIKAELERRGLL